MLPISNFGIATKYNKIQKQNRSKMNPILWNFDKIPIKWLHLKRKEKKSFDWKSFIRLSLSIVAIVCSGNKLIFNWTNQIHCPMCKLILAFFNCSDWLQKMVHFPLFRYNRISITYNRNRMCAQLFSVSWTIDTRTSNAPFQWRIKKKKRKKCCLHFPCHTTNGNCDRLCIEKISFWL